ncbi:glycoside hydrolase [Flavobacterium cheongpyeongense]|jgi:cell wall-associated NlpC family hydrolase|uniref:Glycoside hydrolase n=1 Tax=Flavobacterium cheongpyeongense TaxID=2212651 RepID=A0A2V4BU75_9FLAO|nr:C40 family peptidase [Flavobacterium cheongpyeongense]PXY42588.1 glycoside hydrolase [Flavobacterium cheongpyeongense]
MKTTYPVLIFLFTILFSSFTLKKENKTQSDPVKKIQSAIERDSVISYAKQYLGTRYLYASSNPNKGFDCSGFVYYVFHNFGLTLPRSSSGYKNVGKALKPEDFKVGDVLVFYGYKDRNIIGHVGIICEANGMNSKFIHASSGKAQKVTITALDEEHYTKRFYKCVDILSE